MKLGLLELRTLLSYYDHKENIIVKRTLIALAGALVAAGALPALAASSLNVPVVAAAPSSSAGFSGGATAQLSWNATDSRATDGQPATASVISDGKYLYVRFDASQTAPMIGSAGGDSVAIDLWPNGTSGDVYHYGVGLDGSRTTESTANTAGWESSVATRAGGYTVTMKIPMSVVSAGSSSQVQFSRWIASTGEAQVWAHSGGSSDVAQAGALTFASSVGAAGSQ